MAGALIAVLVLGLAAFFIRWAYRSNQARLALWRDVARRRGGVFHEPGGSFFRRTPHSIECDAGDARVLLDTYVVSHGKNRTSYTRVRAFYPVAAAPIYRVYKEGVLATLGKALGTQDVELGADPEFDRIFMVKCDDPDAVRAAWSPRAMALLRDELRDGRVDSDGERVTLILVGVLSVERRIDAAIDLVGELAGMDLFGLALLRALPSAHFRPAHGPWDARQPPLAELSDPPAVVVQPCRGADRTPATRVSTYAGRRELALDVAVDEAGRFADPAAEAALSPSARRHLDRVGAGRLTAARGTITFTWPSLQQDPRRIEDAARLVVAVGAASQGVFR